MMPLAASLPGARFRDEPGIQGGGAADEAVLAEMAPRKVTALDIL
jgi:hypothetical protein